MIDWQFTIMASAALMLIILQYSIYRSTKAMAEYLACLRRGNESILDTIRKEAEAFGELARLTIEMKSDFMGAIEEHAKAHQHIIDVLQASEITRVVPERRKTKRKRAAKATAA